MDDKDEKDACSKCGHLFDIGEQSCPKCSSIECEAYKPWMRGCNHKGSCYHRIGCPWGGGRN